MTFENLLAELPGDALVPVRWVREHIGVQAAAGMTVEEVAESVRRSPSTVRAMCRAGELEGAYRLRGREWRIPPAAIANMDSDGQQQASENDGEGPSLRAWRSRISDEGR